MKITIIDSLNNKVNNISNILLDVIFNIMQVTDRIILIIDENIDYFLSK